jgi:hypothetical protein
MVAREIWKESEVGVEAYSGIRWGQREYIACARVL